MPLDTDAIKDLKTSISAARKKEMNFALCMGKKDDGTILLIDRIKDSSVLEKQARRDGETAKLASGRIKVDGSKATLFCAEDPPPGCARKLKTFFSKTVGVKLKVLIADINGNVLDDGGDDADEAQGGDGGDSAEAKKWAEILEKLGPVVEKFVNAGKGDVARVTKAWEFACDKANDEDHAAALKIAAKMPGILDEAAETESEAEAETETEGTQGAPEDPSARKKVEEDLKALMPAVKKVAAEAPDQAAAIKELVQTITSALDAHDYDLARVSLTKLEMIPAAYEKQQMSKWEEASKEMLAELKKVFDKGTGNIDQIRKIWSFAEGKAGQKEFRSAFAALEKLRPAIQDALKETATAAARQVAEGTVKAGADVMEILNQVKDLASGIKEASTLLTSKAGDIAKLVAAIQAAAKSKTLNAAQQAFNALQDILNEAAEYKKQLDAALEALAQAVKRAADLRANLAAEFAPGLLDVFARPLGEVDKQLDCGTSTDVAAITQAVQSAGGKMDAVEISAENLRGERAKWQTAHPPMDSRLELLAAHSQAAREAVKALIKRVQDARGAVQDLANQHRYTDAVNGLPAIETERVKAELMADNAAQYYAQHDDREKRLDKEVPKTHDLDDVQKAFLATHKKLTDAEALVAGESPDFAKAAALLKELATDIPAMKVLKKNADFYKDKRADLKQRLDNDKSWDTSVPEIKKMVEELRGWYEDSDYAKTKDFKKSANIIRRAFSREQEVVHIVLAFAAARKQLREAKTVRDDLKAHDGAKGIKKELARMELHYDTAGEKLKNLQYVTAENLAKEIKKIGQEAEKKADLYKEYLDELKKSDEFKSTNTASLDPAVAEQVTACQEWRRKAEDFAKNDKLARAKDAAVTAEHYAATARYTKQTLDALDQDLKDASAEHKFNADKAVFDKTVQDIEGKMGTDNTAVSTPLGQAKGFAATAATAMKAKVVDPETVLQNMKSAITKVREAVVAQSKFIEYNHLSTKAVERIDAIEDVNSEFTDMIRDTREMVTNDAKGKADSGDFDAARAKIAEANTDAIDIERRTKGYKDYLALRDGKIATLKTKLDTAKAKTAMKTDVETFLKRLGEIETTAVDEEEKALKELKEQEKIGDVLSKKLDNYDAAIKEKDTYTDQAMTEARAFAGRFPDDVQKLEDAYKAGQDAIKNLNFAEAEKIWDKLYHKCKAVVRDGQGLTGYEPKKRAAEGKLTELKDQICPPVEPAHKRLTEAFNTAVKLGETDRIYKTAMADMEKIAKDCDPYIQRGKDYKDYAKVLENADKELEALNGKTASMPVVAQGMTALNAERASVESLATKLDFTAAETAAEKLIESCKTLAEKAKAEEDLAKTAEEISAKPADDDSGLAEDVEVLNKQLAALKSHDGRDAIGDELTRLEECAKTAQQAQSESRTEDCRKAINDGMAVAKAALTRAGQSDAAATACTAAEDRLKALSSSYTAPDALVQMLRDLSAQAGAARSKAEAGDWAGAMTSLGELRPKTDTAEQHGKDQAAYEAKSTPIPDQLKELNKSEYRHVIAKEIEEIIAFLAEAGKRSEALEFKLANEACENALKSVELAKIKHKMGGQQEVTEDDIDKILKLPNGAKELDKIMQNLDPRAQRKVCKAALEKRFGIKLEQFKDTEGDEADTDMDTRAPNIMRLYEVLSKLPDSHTIRNPSLDKVQNFGDKPPATGSPETSSSFTPSTKEIELRVGRGDEDSLEIVGQEWQLGEIDADAKPVTGGEPPNTFSWTTLHEIGHAVDDMKGFMKKNGSESKMGGWVEYGGNVGPIAEAASKSTAFDYDKDYIEAYLSGSAKLPPDPPSGVDQDEWDQRRIAVETWCDAIRSDKEIYYSASETAKRVVDGRVYQEAYKRKWVSYEFAARKKGVAGYQFRAPGEWFAELYAAFHTGKMNPQHPAREWLQKL